MSHLRITCPHCDQAMQVKSADAHKSLQCAKCQQVFQHVESSKSERKSADENAVPQDGGKKDVPVLRVRHAAGKKVIKVACQACKERFGIKPKMSGKKIVCPVCSQRQIFELTAVEAKTKTANDETEPATESDGAPTDKKESVEQRATPAKARQSRKTGPVAATVKKKQEDGNRATVIHSGGKQEASGAASFSGEQSMSERARELLPPRYLVPAEVDQQAVSTVRQTATSTGILLGIETDVARIHREDGDVVEVSSLTPEQKRRRRRLRVVIVYLVSVIVLVAWFIWLLKQTNPEG